MLNFILYFMNCVCSVPQSCPTLCDPMDCSLPGSYVHRIFQARMLERVDISYSRVSSQPRDWSHIPCVSYTGRHSLYLCVTWEASFYALVALRLSSLCFILFSVSKTFIHVSKDNIIFTKRLRCPLSFSLYKHLYVFTDGVKLMGLL